MKIRLTTATIDRWRRDLRVAGQREIGGILFGEQVAEGDFRVLQATGQRFGGGGRNRFHRRAFQARTEVARLHRRYGGEAARFNYLGEWHSHPNAAAIPSAQDALTMRGLVRDQAGTVNFLVLLIVRIGVRGTLELGGTAYLASGHVLNCDIVGESEAFCNDDH